MNSPSLWLPLLRKIFFLSSLTENQLSLVAKKMNMVCFPKGAILFHEGDSSDAVYLILAGSIILTQKDTSHGEPRKKVMAYLTRGDAFGEMSFLSGGQHNATAQAESTAEVLVLKKEDFDHLVDKVPTLGVHISRILSRRMVNHDFITNKNSNNGKVFSLLLAMPARDQVVFSINLGISMVEQTRKKVLMVFIHETPQIFANSLGLECHKPSAVDIENGLFDHPEKMNSLLLVHPSGLEILLIDKKVCCDCFERAHFSFSSYLQDQYDTSFVVMSCDSHPSLISILLDSTKISVASSQQSSPQDLEQIKKIQTDLADRKKIEHIWLSIPPDLKPIDYFPDIKINWKPEWGSQFMETGSPFIPTTDRTGHRSFDRLARRYAGLVIGLAMGSGAAFGYAVIGILKILEREGIYPDVVSGTSMGALLGAFYSAGISPTDLEKIAASITRRRLWQMADPTIPRSGLIRGNGVLQFLRSHLGDKTFADLELPFACVATDIQTGKEIILDRHNVADAVRASLSLPFFFQPYYLDGRYLVDGGLVNPVPTSLIVNLGANILLSANLTSRTSDRKVPHVLGWRRRLPHILRGPSITEIMLKTIYTMQYEISSARSSLAHVVMQVNTSDLLWWDLDRSTQMVKIGEAVAEENLQKIKSLLPFFSDHCRIHLSPRGRKKD